MNITDPIDKAYPKVKPLTQALVAAAKEQGATVEEFRMACARVEQMIERKTRETLFSELRGQEQIVSRLSSTEVTITEEKVTGQVWSIDEDGKMIFPIMCPHCGQENPEYANFCRRCGVKLKDVCDCWIKKKPYNCKQRRCPGYRLFLAEK